jgi:hypothetical protein
MSNTDAAKPQDITIEEAKAMTAEELEARGIKTMTIDLDAELEALIGPDSLNGFPHLFIDGTARSCPAYCQYCGTSDPKQYGQPCAAHTQRRQLASRETRPDWSGDNAINSVSGYVYDVRRPDWMSKELYAHWISNLAWSDPKGFWKSPNTPTRGVFFLTK